jgi:hypothetical protein
MDPQNNKQLLATLRSSKLMRRTDWTTTIFFKISFPKCGQGFEAKRETKLCPGGAWNIKSMEESSQLKSIGNKTREATTNSLKGVQNCGHGPRRAPPAWTLQGNS